MNTAKKLDLKKLSQVTAVAINKTPADQDIDLDLIDVLPQIRKKFADLEEFASSIQQHGVIAPIVVHKEDGGRYRLICGERRVRAAKMVGLKKIPASIKSNLSELDIRAIQVAENNDRSDLTFYETVMGVIEDYEKHGNEGAAIIWNRSKGWISKRVAVKRFRPELVKLMESELCTDLEILADLNQLSTTSHGEKDFNRFCLKASKGESLSRDETRFAIARLKQNEQQASALKADVQPTPSSATEQKPTKKPSDAARSRADLNKQLTTGLEYAFEYGQTHSNVFNEIQSHARDLKRDPDETEWLLWQAFLSSVLPSLQTLTPGRAKIYLQKLQLELKKKSPQEIWEELHPTTGADGDRLAVCPKPEDWSL